MAQIMLKIDEFAVAICESLLTSAYNWYDPRCEINRFANVAVPFIVETEELPIKLFEFDPNELVSQRFTV